MNWYRAVDIIKCWIFSCIVGGTVLFSIYENGDEFQHEKSKVSSKGGAHLTYGDSFFLIGSNRVPG